MIVEKKVIKYLIRHTFSLNWLKQKKTESGEKFNGGGGDRKIKT